MLERVRLQVLQERQYAKRGVCTMTRNGNHKSKMSIAIAQVTVILLGIRVFGT